VVSEAPDPNARFRARRLAAAQRRRARIRRRRGAALVLLGLAGTAIVLGANAVGGDGGSAERDKSAAGERSVRAAPKPLEPRPLPREMRGVHVTMPLASLPGRIDQYLSIPGLNTLELDIKDENGEVGFVSGAPRLARTVGAAKAYFRPRQVVAKVRRSGAYLIGRLVVFQDPVLAEARPRLAVSTGDGSVWRTSAGHAWTNPYDKRVWAYNVAVARAAAKAGFDEIQFDYVRFPSDGDVSAAVFRGGPKGANGWVIAGFVQYAAKRLRPLGVRVSVDLFGLSATRDLGVGQVPRRIARYVDAIYPMVYPSHYRSGEHGLDDPSSKPALTVSRSLLHFQRELRGRKAKLIPWLEDFSLGRTRTAEEVRAQIEAAREAGTSGYLLWNPVGEYTDGMLAGTAESAP
jgi:hypothetical protein